MKISSVEIIPIAIPFDYGGQSNAFGWQKNPWRSLDTTLVRIETDDGLVGWGDAFSYCSQRPVQAILEDMIKPALIGEDASDIAGLMYRLQKSQHLFGRYGMTIHALSAVDIALWDIAGKAAGKPLCQLLGGIPRSDLIGYSSLFRYGDAELAAAKTGRHLMRVSRR